MAGRGSGRIGRLPARDHARRVRRARGAACCRRPPAASGRPATPVASITTVAVCGGAGDTFLADATAAGVDAYLTADLRHHPASEHLAGGGPALIDAAHWATERPWLDDVAAVVGPHRPGHDRLGRGHRSVDDPSEREPAAH